jgi:Mg-chelatase subunit ChlD
MDWATKRQLQYFGIIILVVVIFIVVPFFVFIYKAPTCFDGFKNGGETGIDCGGSCRLLCPAQISEPISRWDPRIFNISTSTYGVLAYLENPNVAAEVYNAPYSFKLYDAQGILVTERAGTTYIPKGGNFAVLEPNINTGERIPVRATFSFTKVLTWVRNTNKSPSIEITNETLISTSTTPRVEATVKNNSLDRVPNIDLTVIVFDGAGNAIGASRTYIDALSPGQSQNITFTWPAPFATKAEVCSAPVDVELVLDRSGSMSALGANPPQPLSDVKSAAIYFLNQLDQSDQAGLVSFATTATTTNESLLSSNFTSIEHAIDSVAILKDGIQETNITDGITKAIGELSSTRHRDGVSSVLVLLTDGVATLPKSIGDKSYPENSAIATGQSAKGQGIQIFTIGLGKDVNVDFLKNLASNPDDFYAAPTTKELTGIYTQIATKICTKKPASIQIIPRLFPYNIAF